MKYKLYNLLTLILLIGCNDNKMSKSSDNNIPEIRCNVTSNEKGFLQLSKKLDIPLKKVSPQASEKLKSIYQEYDINFIVNSWFEKPFLLILENGKFIAKTQTLNSDGFPNILNWSINFGSIDIIEEDEFISKYSKDGFFQIGEAENGDPLVIDLESKTFDVGYLDHEFVWQKKNKNVRQYYESFAPFSKFIEKLINDEAVPNGYKY